MLERVGNVGKSWKRYKMLWMLRDCESDIASTNLYNSYNNSNDYNFKGKNRIFVAK